MIFLTTVSYFWFVHPPSFLELLWIRPVLPRWIYAICRQHFLHCRWPSGHVVALMGL